MFDFSWHLHYWIIGIAIDCTGKGIIRIWIELGPASVGLYLNKEELLHLIDKKSKQVK